MENRTTVETRRPGRQANELNLLQLAILLWDHKRLIGICTAAATLIGAAYAFLATPIYYSQAIVALKEAKGNDASRLFSQLGGLGGMVASQMGLGSTNLDKIDVILRGHELADSVIRKNDLLPALFPELWDAGKKAWKPKDAKDHPTIRDGITLLGDEIMALNVDAKKNIIQIGANSPDPAFAKRLVELFMDELNNKIRSDALIDAEKNRRYLEAQLNNTTDPILIQKIQTMVGMEIEKYMLVNSRAFDVLDPPLVPLKSAKPRRLIILLLSFLFGLVASSLGIFLKRSAPALREARDAGIRVAAGQAA